MRVVKEILLAKKKVTIEVIAGLERMLRERVAYLDAINKALEKEDEPQTSDEQG